MIIPIWITFASSTHDNGTIISKGMQWSLGNQFIENYDKVLNKKGGFSQEITASSMLINSLLWHLVLQLLRYLHH